MRALIVLVDCGFPMRPTRRLQNSPYAGILYLVYSADKGETFNLIKTITPLDPGQVPESVRPFYTGLDYDFLATGPDATNLNYETVWTSIGDAFDACAPNEYQQKFLDYASRVSELSILTSHRSSNTSFQAVTRVDGGRWM